MEVLLENVIVDIAPPEAVTLTLDLNSYITTVGGGGGSTPAYIHTQSSPADTWIINHNLGYKPVIQLFNTGSQQIAGSVVNVSTTQTNVYFSISVGGYARLL